LKQNSVYIIIRREKLKELENIKINVNMPIFDFKDYSYSEKIIESKQEQKSSVQYIFPTRTCLDNQLIILTARS